MGEVAIERRHHGAAAVEGDGEKLAQQRVGRATEAQIDHLRLLIDGEMQRHGQAQAVADGGDRSSLGHLPAGAQSHQPGMGRDTDYA